MIKISAPIWASILCVAGILLTPLYAQVQPAAPVTAVLTILTVRSNIDRAQVTKILPAEVRATVKLYLDGKIQQWYARSDGKGVVFVMNCGTVAEAKALTDTLPLSKAQLVTFEYTPLTPLTPLRLLLASPANGNP